MKFRGGLIAVAMLAMVLCAARPILGCGPFFNMAIYSFAYHPDLPLDNYAAGQLGIVQSGWARSYLYVAYRYLAGGGFDADERKALMSLWMDRLNAFQAPTFLRRAQAMVGCARQGAGRRRRPGHRRRPLVSRPVVLLPQLH
ncbi:MAG TPA: hypothetical protein VGY99_15260 [Candidatus Binataceae bacterium]|jgi:hypothetical protein|nr:hypothetical protein [Candidatus Binataceae bacterium]